MQSGFTHTQGAVPLSVSGAVSGARAVPSAGPSRDGYSSKGTFMACPRRYALWRLLGIVPAVEPEARARGSLIHAALMWHYMAKRGDSCAQGVDIFQKMRELPDRYAHQYVQAEQIVKEYTAYWDTIGDWPGHAILAIEREYTVWLQHPAGGPAVEHTQRLDLTVAVNGKAYVLDHKSSTGSVNTAVRDWEHSGQFAMLEVIGKAIFSLPPPIGHGLPYGGIILNHIGSKPPFVFERRQVYPVSGFVASTPVSMVEAAWRREALRASGVRPDRYPQQQTACRDRYGWCDYLRICGLGDVQTALSTGNFQIDENIRQAAPVARPVA